MVNKEVVDYIKRMSDKGFSLKEIRGKLKESGHSEKDIEDCIAAVTKEKPAAEKKAIVEEEFAPIIEERRFSPKKILVIILCLIVIGSAPFGLKLYKEYFGGKEAPQIEEKPRLSPQIEESPKKLELDYEKIYQEEFEKCMDDPEIHQCVAYVTDDLSLCNKWVELDNDTVERDWCFDRAFLFKKIALENIYPCDKMMHGSTKLMCNAIKTGEKSGCDSIEEGALKGLCNSMISNRESCGGLTSEDKEGCQELFKLCSALKQNKMEMCELLGSNRLKITCKALISNDPEICKNIKSCEDEAGLNAQRIIEESKQGI